MLEGVAGGSLEHEYFGEETVKAERLLRYDVVLDAKTTSRVWLRSDGGAVRRIALGLMNLWFAEPVAAPDPSAFHWSARAPSGAAVEQFR